MSDVYSIYTKNGPCQYCTSSIELLLQKDVEYYEYIVGVHLPRSVFIEMFPEAKTYPVIVKNKKVLGGFAELKVDLGA